MKPDLVRADYLEAVDCAPFEPGYEGLVVELVFDLSCLDTVRRIHEVVSSDRQNLSEHQWYVVRPRPIGSDRIRFSLASPLVPYLQDGGDISHSLSDAALWALERLLSAVGTVVGAGNAAQPPFAADGGGFHDTAAAAEAATLADQR